MMRMNNFKMLRGGGDDMYKKTTYIYLVDNGDLSDDYRHCDTKIL